LLTGPGTTAIGVKGRDVVVLAIEKKAAQKLQDERTLQKIVKIDAHLGIVFAGLTADARVLLGKVRRRRDRVSVFSR
jgi:20S proteasome subunit alpha 4